MALIQYDQAMYISSKVALVLFHLPQQITIIITSHNTNIILFVRENVKQILDIDRTWPVGASKKQTGMEPFLAKHKNKSGRFC